MKSIMQEASSIAKAIEEAWKKVGSPTNFSIKIFEHPQKNFFGMTTHPAKIALFFDIPERENRPERHEKERIRPVRPLQERSSHERQPVKAREPQHYRDFNHHTNESSRETRELRVERSHEPRHERTPVARRPADHASAPAHHQPREIARPEVRPHSTAGQHDGDAAPLHEQADAYAPRQWDEHTLLQVRAWLERCFTPQAATLEIEGGTCYVRFNDPFHKDQSRNEQVCKALALLSLNAVRHALRKPLRGLRIHVTA